MWFKKTNDPAKPAEPKLSKDEQIEKLQAENKALKEQIVNLNEALERVRAFCKQHTGRRGP